MAKGSNTITGAVLRNLLAAIAAGAVAAVTVAILLKSFGDASQAPVMTPAAVTAPRTASALPEVTPPTMHPSRPFKSPGFPMPRRPLPLQVVNRNTYPTRLAEGPRGWIFATDAKCGSVFYYNQDLELKNEIKGMRRPLGIAVDKMTVMVGNDATDAVEVYNKFNGKKMYSLGAGEIKMPTDLKLDGRGKLYVVDSRSHVVKVYWVGRLRRRWLMDIGEPGDGEGQLAFPVSVDIVRRRDSDSWRMIEEVFVADQGNKRIQVFDTEGNFLRYYDAIEPEVAGFSMASAGMKTSFGGFGWNLGNDDPFQKLQSLAIDTAGNIHTLDNFRNRVLVLNGSDGEVVGEYSEYGAGQGQLNLPLDILITKRGRVLVANTLNKRIEELQGLQ